MTPFEYIVTAILSAVGGATAISSQTVWWRVVGVVVLFAMTFYAGLKGGVML